MFRLLESALPVGFPVCPLLLPLACMLLSFGVLFLFFSSFLSPFSGLALLASSSDFVCFWGCIFYCFVFLDLWCRWSFFFAMLSVGSSAVLPADVVDELLFGSGGGVPQFLVVGLWFA